MANFRGIRSKGSGIEVYWQFEGKRFSEYINRPANKTNLANAARYREQAIVRCRLGEYEPTASITFQQCCNLALSEKASRVKRSTLDSYRSKLSCYWHTLADRPIHEITLKDLRAIDRDTKWSNPKTRNNAVSALKQVFKYAFYEELIEVDPTLRLRPQKHQKPEIDAFTPAEQEAVLGALQGRFRLFYRIMFEAGLRTGEVQALKWGDWKGLTLRVSRSMYRGEESGTKTHQARTVRITHAIEREIKQQERVCEFIIHHNGKPYTTDRTPSYTFKRACEKAKVRYRRPYYCRHTYATRALERGESPIAVAGQLGDRVETMLRNYAGTESLRNPLENQS